LLPAAANSPATAQESATAANVDASRLNQRDQQPGNWMSYGRTYSEQRFSPLQQINDQTFGRSLSPWYVDLTRAAG